MSMHNTHPNQHRGFSLVEVMVGLAIGMATVVIMMQMLSNSDAMKRTASGGNDAQMTGTLALYTLERDIRESGYGISAFNILGCKLTFTTTSGTTVSVPLAPTTINATVVPAGDANTDTLLVVYGNSNGSSEGDALISTSTANSYQVATSSSFRKDDVLIAQGSVRPPEPCTVTSDKVLSADDTTSTLTVDPGVSGLALGSVIYNMGSAPVIHAYAIRKGNLTMCDYTATDCGNATAAAAADPTIWVPIAGNITGLRAQYGRDTTPPPAPMVGIVDTYDQITPASSADPLNGTPQCAWARALAVRLVVVARSSAYDKTGPTTVAPTWSGSVTSGTSPKNPTATPIDLSANSDWQNYRYKTLETTVPLRNAIWQGGQPTYQGGQGC
ncbi:hypothetical protein JY96_13155 [Aquabacterium sp. NJ1]|nr:hypothetical protein JY96_13155 [Aquabacterium sp. NJ1]